MYLIPVLLRSDEPRFSSGRSERIVQYAVVFFKASPTLLLSLLHWAPSLDPTLIWKSLQFKISAFNVVPVINFFKFHHVLFCFYVFQPILHDIFLTNLIILSYFLRTQGPMYSKTMTATYDPENGMPVSATSLWFGENPLADCLPNLPPAELAKMYQPLSLIDKAINNAG